jgi:hypothetical protein
MLDRRDCRLGAALVLCGLCISWLTVWADDKSPAGDPDQLVVELYTKSKLLDKKEYKAVRAAFAKRFETKYLEQIKTAYGDDYDAFAKWLDDNPDIKEDFYTAINEENDNLDLALKLFKDIWKKWPEKFKQYYNLAIATAVVWDGPKNVYDYRGHQVRTHSTLPSEVMQIGPMDNFQYFLDNESTMQKRAELLPWEFLVYMVNNRTPINERKWSQKEYLNKRAMIGQCYKDVPYDTEMLRSKSKNCKLEGQEYNLANIRSCGGVCAMQADFAARVAKSIGVPGEFVWGEGNNNDLHAWIMWVEVKNVVKDKVDFKLESYGRYGDMQFYTGKLKDPQTGEDIIDRDMELRLSVVGYERIAKRHAELIMRAYPLICDKQNLDTKGKLNYLDKCLAICPYNEAAWLALAKMSRNDELKKEHLSTMMSHADKLLKTFTNFPDFTWKVLEDLLALQKNQSERSKLFDRLVHLYENAGRPDLACEARIQLADYQVEAKKFQDAANGIANTIRKFPDEGRYVPKMMEKLQEVCKQYKGGTDLLGSFYLELLPHIKPSRAGEVSKYCVNMYKQAIAFFQENKKDMIAADLSNKLAKIERGTTQ